MMNSKTPWLSVAVLGFILGAAMPARAQIGPQLVMDPWGSEPQWASTVDEPIFINGGHDKRSDKDLDIFYWDSQGRIKFDRNDADPNFWMGYRVLAIDINSSSLPGLPDELTDIALVGAVKLGGSEGWQFTLMAGAGTANDSHFSNGDAVYGIGNLNATHVIDEKSKLHLGVNYNGNRTFLPDIPLPYAVYEHKVDKTLAYRVGVPGSGFVWRPLEQLVFQAEYAVPTNLSGNASYWFSECFSVFAEYKKTLDGFYLDGRENTRLFYEMSRVATGVRVIWQPYVDARLGVGYAFDQEFSRDFDVRDTDTFVQPSDEVLFFFTIQGTF